MIELTDEIKKMHKAAGKSLEHEAVLLKNSSDLSIWKLVHELQVHQIELEMQNEELRKAKLELEESRKKYSDLYDLAPVGYFTFDIKGLILEANLRSTVQLDRNRNSLINNSFYNYLNRDDRDIFYIHLRGVFKGKTGQTCEVRLTGRGESEFHAQLDSIPVQDSGGNITCRTSVIDITKRKRTEEELNKFRDNLKKIVKERTEELTRTNQQLREEIIERQETERKLKISHRQLQDLAGHLQFIREEERSKITREIHDELGQSMTALRLDLSWLDRRLGKGEEALSGKVWSMSKLTEMTIGNVQRLISELRPGLLDHLGLAAAIEWQTKQFQNRTGIKCEIVIKPENITLDKDRSTAVFRILQESLTNIVRHAEAREVSVILKAVSDKLILSVRNDGNAIRREQIDNPGSFGLLGMRERVHFLGGELMIRGIKDQGTIVTATIPIEEEEVKS